MNHGSRYMILLQGGIGNQLFQYAYAKYLYCVEGKTANTYHNFKGDNYKRENIVKEIDPDICIRIGLASRLMMIVTSLPANIITQSIRQCASILGLRLTIKQQEESRYYQYIEAMKENGVTILNGYWQSAEMVNSVKEELLKHIKCDELSIDYQDIADKISNNPASVAVHIRQNWHIGYDGDTTGTADTHPQQVLSRYYYAKSIRCIQAKSKKTFFFIFADDNDELSNFIGDILPKEQFLVVPNHNDFIADYQALILMSQCKHFIISNSTFGWWGAWLSWAKHQEQNAGAIYCMPNRWDRTDKDGQIAQGFKFSPQCILMND